MAWNSRFLIVSLLVIASCSSESSPDADDLIGTWDYPLDQTQSQLTVEGFAAEGFTEVESAEEVVIRLGFDVPSSGKASSSTTSCSCSMAYLKETAALTRLTTTRSS
jgi:hypothetical protein